MMSRQATMPTQIRNGKNRTTDSGQVCSKGSAGGSFIKVYKSFITYNLSLLVNTVIPEDYQKQYHTVYQPFINLAMQLGVALIALGVAGKLCVRAYRSLKAKDFVNPNEAYKIYKGAFYQDMTRRQAQLILGVTEGADSKVIKDRHRKLMLINHPDNGGSTYVATKINQAKDMLLK